jgi:RNA polymerase sigma-70 factor (ECF subfamily)
MASSSGFATTRWSLVLAAGQPRADEDGADAQAALEMLCQAYWMPVYAYLRRRSAQVDDAQELTQAFFAHLLERNALAAAAPDRGRFRAFLLTACKHFVAHERERERAQKRGGGVRTWSLDFESGEARFQLEPVDCLTPERLFERQWALTLLDRVLQLLRAEFARHGRERNFDLLKAYLGGTAPESYALLGEQLDLSEGAARVAVHRLRRQYRELLREEIAQTVASPEQVDDEIRDLFAALA